MSQRLKGTYVRYHPMPGGGLNAYCWHVRTSSSTSKRLHIQVLAHPSACTLNAHSCHNQELAHPSIQVLSSPSAGKFQRLHIQVMAHRVHASTRIFECWHAQSVASPSASTSKCLQAQVFVHAGAGTSKCLNIQALALPSHAEQFK